MFSSRAPEAFGTFTAFGGPLIYCYTCVFTVYTGIYYIYRQLPCHMVPYCAQRRHMVLHVACSVATVPLESAARACSVATVALKIAARVCSVATVAHEMAARACSEATVALKMAFEVTFEEAVQRSCAL